VARNLWLERTAHERNENNMPLFATLSHLTDSGCSRS
jgi:hypothetical protein